MTEPPTGPTGTRSRPRRIDHGSADADRIAELEARLERLEGSPSLRERGRSVLDRMMPPEAATHFRNAGREQLLGIRTIVDHWINRLDESESRAGASRRADRETIVIE
jgi:hypothetical protein